MNTQIEYPITQLLAHFYYTADHHHRQYHIYKDCDCENKLKQFEEFYKIFRREENAVF